MTSACDQERAPDQRPALSGVGVHSGRAGVVRLARAWGPSAISLRGAAPVPFTGLAVVDTTRSTTVGAMGATARTVEHLCAALAGLGLHDGVAVTLEGEEVPLLDGGAAEFARALLTLELPAVAPRLEVKRDATIEIEQSQFQFFRGGGVELEVVLDFPGAPIEPRARWTGDRDDFVSRIAPARTFALEGELAALGEAALARFADSRSVVVVGDRLHGAGTVLPDEPARHKLLDLLGDMFLHGGPPRGRVVALRPGHRSNHAALRTAIDRGILRAD